MLALLHRLSRFAHDKSGNIATIFALSLVPLVSVVGCAVDYSRANQLRSKLQSAIDAASVGSVSKTSPGFNAAGAMTGDGPIPAGVTDATNIFNANMSGVTGYTLNRMTPVMTKTGSTITSTIRFSADIPTMFLGVISKTSMTVTGTSTSTANMPLYIDFYLLLDNSPSMGVGATPADVATMVNHTSDSCAFACHDLNDSNNYYKLAKSLGVTTRIDVLRSATQQLMDTAASTQTYSSQFRMALYDFGGSSGSQGLRALFALSSSLSSAKTAAGSIDLMTVNGQNDNRLHHDPAGDQQRNLCAGNRHIVRAAEISVLRVRRRRRRKQFGLPQADIRLEPLPIADQPRALHHDQESRHQDCGALHHLSRAADQQLVHELDRSIQSGTLWSLAEQPDRAEHVELRFARPVLRGQSDAGHLAGDECIVPEGRRRRADQQLAGRGRMERRRTATSG